MDMADAKTSARSNRRHHPVRRPEFGHRGARHRRRPRWCSSWACRCWESATACRPWPHSWAARSRRQGARVRLCRGARAQGHSRLLEASRTDVNDKGDGIARRVDEPRRQGDTPCRPGFVRHRRNAGMPPRRHGRRGAALLRGAVPSRSDPHKQGKEIYARFVHDICGCGRDWNMPRLHPARRSRAYPRAGGQRGGDPRAVGRGGLLGGGGADPQRDRRAAHLHLRGHGPAAS